MTIQLDQQVEWDEVKDRNPGTVDRVWRAAAAKYALTGFHVVNKLY
ncbi:hypothetical protein [Arthrobacter sp. ISL-30]|nr:hypothetical protein [Arthrobacter sp. ISL-30]MBT2513168.1 hypothetical protein [Arthrobacter sp. ISL-30]